MGVNAGKSQHSGIEGSFRLPLYRSTQDQGPTVLVNVSGAYTAAVFKEFIDLERNYAGNYLPGLPRSNVLLGIELNNWQQFSFFATWRMVGSQFLDDANTIQEPAYQLLDLSTKRMFSLKKIKFELFSGVRNLTNSHYASMILINAPSFGGRAPRYYYPGEPRNYFLGFKVLFDN